MGGSGYLLPLPPGVKRRRMKKVAIGLLAFAGAVAAVWAMTPINNVVTVLGNTNVAYTITRNYETEKPLYFFVTGANYTNADTVTVSYASASGITNTVCAMTPSAAGNATFYTTNTLWMFKGDSLLFKGGTSTSTATVQFVSEQGT